MGGGGGGGGRGGWSYRMGGLCHYVSECYGLMLHTCIHDLQKLAIF